MRAVVLLGLLAGCHRVFGLDPPEGDARGVDAPGDAAVDPLPCSPIDLLGTDFSSDPLAAWWPGSSSTQPNQLAVANGELEFRASTENGYVTMESMTAYDFTSSPFTLKMTDAGALGDANFRVTLTGAAPDRSATFARAQGLVILYARDDAGDTVVSSRPYSVTTDVYLRIAMVSGSVVYSTSADGVTFDAITSRPLDGMELASVTIQTYRPIGVPGFTMTIDDVMGGMHRGTACDIARLTDDFSTTTLGPQWASSATNGQQTTDEGRVTQLTASASEAQQASVFLTSSTLFDLTDSQFVVEVPKVTDSDVAKTVTLDIGAYAGHRVHLQKRGANLSAISVMGVANTPYAVAYSPLEHRWWRIRNAAGITYWDVSADGADWKPFGSQAGLDLSRVTVTLSTHSTSDDPDTAQFDNVNR